MMKLRRPLVGAGVIGALGLAVFSFWGEETPAASVPAPREPVRPTVAVRDVAPANPVVAGEAIASASARPADCLIEPSQVVKVNSSVEGVIASIGADRGQFVHRGQVVAQLRAQVETASLAVARARAANTFSIGANAVRARYLDSKQQRSEKISRYLARDSVEEAQANAQAAAMQTREAELVRHVSSLEAEHARRLLAERVVRSPVDGVVTERAMSPGEYRSNQNSHIMTIAQINPLHVEVFAPIAQLNTVAVGDTAYVFPESPVGGRYAARVKVIDRVFDAASGTFGLRLELPNPGNRLPAGLRCRIQFDA